MKADLIIIDDPIIRQPEPFPSLPQKQTYNCPADTKLIPFLVDGICRHWYLFTGDSNA